MAIEIVDFPMNSMVIFHCYVSSPEGTTRQTCLEDFGRVSKGNHDGRFWADSRWKLCALT